MLPDPCQPSWRQTRRSPNTSGRISIATTPIAVPPQPAEPKGLFLLAVKLNCFVVSATGSTGFKAALINLVFNFKKTTNGGSTLQTGSDLGDSQTSERFDLYLNDDSNHLSTPQVCTNGLNSLEKALSHEVLSISNAGLARSNMRADSLVVFRYFWFQTQPKEQSEKDEFQYFIWIY